MQVKLVTGNTNGADVVVVVVESGVRAEMSVLPVASTSSMTVMWLSGGNWAVRAVGGS